jgi:DNA-3-methyladenine glycosylase
MILGMYNSNLETLEKNILPREFYLQDTFECLKQCLGKIVVRQDLEGLTVGRIVEAEAYLGGVDKASHSYLNKFTPRTKIQFGLGGHAYIFSVHTYNQFCFVTGAENVADVVLIRGIEPISGIDLMKQRRPGILDDKNLTNGPGKLCISFNITKQLYGADLTDPTSGLFLTDDNFQIADDQIVKTARVGIDYAEEYKDMPWRYYIKGNQFVSKK